MSLSFGDIFPHNYSAPLKQISQGILPEKVLCQENTPILIIKYSEKSSACVTESAAQKLVSSHGWGFENPECLDKSGNRLYEFVLITEKQEYSLNDSVVFKIKNCSTNYHLFHNTCYPLIITSEKGEILSNQNILCGDAETPYLPNAEHSHDLRTYVNMQVGDYVIQLDSNSDQKYLILIRE